jgi:tetratricopeptide (TPR) repeat protein
MKREVFATHTGVSVEAVKKWEKRKETIELSAPYAARMDGKLREADAVVVERFWSILQGPATVSVEAGDRLGTLLESGADTEHILVPARTATGEVVLVSVPRRAFVTGVGAGAVGMAASVALSSKSLAAVFARTDIDHIKFFRDKRMHIIESDNIYGSAGTLPDVLASLDRMQALREAKVVDSQGILRLLAMYAETAAWQYQDQRMFPEAQRWAEKALTWSHQLGDNYYIGLSLVRMSQLASDRGDGASSGELAQAATRTAPRTSLFTAAAVAYNAHALALEGDSTASARTYDTARALVGQADTDPAWGFFLDHSYIDAYQAHSLTALGDHTAAITQFDDATARMQSGYPRDRGVYLARAAVAHMAAGHIEPAAALGTQALQIGVATGSGRIMERVMTLAA